MTPEQEAELFIKIGGLDVKIESYHNDTKKALNLITGNGRPEDGILFIVNDIRKMHRTCPVQTGELPDRVAKLEIADAVHEAKDPSAKKNLKGILTDVIANPMVERAIIIIVTGILFTIAGWFGFSPKDKHHTPQVEATIVIPR
jgi:hypothetical protein